MVSRSPPKGLQSTPRTCGCRGSTTRCGEGDRAGRACITQCKGASREMHRSSRPVEIPGNAQGAQPPPLSSSYSSTPAHGHAGAWRQLTATRQGPGPWAEPDWLRRKSSQKPLKQAARMLVQRRGVLHTELQTVAPGDQQPGAATQAANVLFRLEHQAGGPPVGLYIPGAGR